MSTRIRYIKHAKGGWISMRAYRDYQGHDIQPRLWEDGKTGSVVFSGSEEEIFKVQASSPHKLKIKLKSVLEALGVNFETEQRNKENEND